MLCNEEYLYFRQANATEATSECLIVFNIGIPVHFDDAWCHSVTHPIVFTTLRQSGWKSKAVNMKNYCIYSNKHPGDAAIHKS